VRASNLGGSALAIPASSQNPELAYDFIVNALADVENQLRILFDYGLTPSLLPLLDSPRLEQGVEFFGGQAVWADILGTLGEVPAVSGTQFFQEAREVMIGIVNSTSTAPSRPRRPRSSAPPSRSPRPPGCPIAP
jgi:lactose/L-arabinose transport system substrate-binding protein